MARNWASKLLLLHQIREYFTNCMVHAVKKYMLMLMLTLETNSQTKKNMVYYPTEIQRQIYL